MTTEEWDKYQQEVIESEFPSKGEQRMKIEDFEELTVRRYKIEQQEHWLSWVEKIPYLKFPAGWQVQVIPPFCGAMARFRVRTEKCLSGTYISVYLDCYNRVGYYDGPYWEAYPIRGETYRCKMEETDELLEALQGEIASLEQKG